MRKKTAALCDKLYRKLERLEETHTLAPEEAAIIRDTKMALAECQQELIVARAEAEEARMKTRTYRS